MSDRTVSIAGVTVPRLLYGTAWKEEETQRLTELALQHGFRGIDVANQRRHYDEAAVGKAISQAIQSGVVTRDELFLQTKFTFKAGQDHRLPYDPDAPVTRQVEQSFASSQEHLGVDVIDSYILHGPSVRTGLTAADWDAWCAMEAIHESGRARLLGVSNVNLDQLQKLVAGARIRPHLVQNRCYAARGWDREIRNYCATFGATYQGFSLLTGNREVLVHRDLVHIAQRHQRSVSEAVFCFALAVGMLALTGTTDAEHMRLDLSIFDFDLQAEEVARIERLLLP